MAAWWLPGQPGDKARAVICLPGEGTEQGMRTVLEYCLQRGREVVAVTGGRLAWHDARRILRSGRADVVVTLPGGPTGPAVEIARSGVKAVCPTPALDRPAGLA